MAWCDRSSPRTRPAGSGAAPILASAGLLLVGCAPFAELQGARLAGRGRTEITGSFSSVSYSEGGQTETLQREYTGQLAVGTGERTDWRFRYTYIGPPDGGGGGLHVFGAGPKYSVVRDRFAAAIPVGFGYGQDIDVGDTFQVHPTILFTFPAAAGLDVNLSGKMLIRFTGGETGFAANLGLAIGPDLPRWALRPEVGVLAYTSTSGYFRHASIGLSWGW